MEIVSAILSIIGIILVVIWWRKEKGQPKSLPQKNKIPQNPEALIIENVGVGGVLQISTVEEPYLDYKLVITGKNRYQDGNYQWFEIVGDNGVEKISIEYERDDKLVIGVQIKKLKLRDLSLNQSDLDRFDEEEEGSFFYEGIQFYYEDSGEALFYPDCDESKVKKLYYWDFQSGDGKHLMGCEFFEDNSLEITYSVSIKESDVEVLSLKEL